MNEKNQPKKENEAQLVQLTKRINELVTRGKKVTTPVVIQTQHTSQTEKHL
jgi:hypothetical protein